MLEHRNGTNGHTPLSQHLLARGESLTI